MAAAFMALVAALAGERFGAAVGRRLLWRLVAAGVATVVWWGARDGQGQGNLLPYYVVQVGAVAAVPLLLVGRPREAGPRAPWGVALVLYVVAKALEDHDRAVFDTLGVSGHTLKHLAAAAAIGALVLELRRRARAWRPAAADARPSTPGDGSGGTSDRAASRR
jgi:thiazole synthase ThiGH ThiG subunit